MGGIQKVLCVLDVLRVCYISGVLCLINMLISERSAGLS